MKQLFGAIPAILRDLDHEGKTVEAVVFATWVKCAGDLLRARTAPVTFRQKRLIIAVRDKTWSRHLEDLSPQLLVKINGILGQGTVRFIEFHIDEAFLNLGSSELVEPIASPNRQTDLSPSLVNAANVIADEDLRKQFLGTAAAYLAKQEH